MSTKDTNETTQQEKKAIVTHIVPKLKTSSLRRRSSLKPRRSMLKVKSLRPTRAVIGKID